MEKSEKNKDHSSKRNLKEKDTNTTNGKSTGSEPPLFLRFSGLAFEMLVTIGVSTYGGYLLDDYLELSFPLFLVSLSMLSLLVSLYLLFKRLPKE